MTSILLETGKDCFLVVPRAHCGTHAQGATAKCSNPSAAQEDQAASWRAHPRLKARILVWQLQVLEWRWRKACGCMRGLHTALRCHDGVVFSGDVIHQKMATDIVTCQILRLLVVVNHFSRNLVRVVTLLLNAGGLSRLVKREAVVEAPLFQLCI